MADKEIKVKISSDAAPFIQELRKALSMIETLKKATTSDKLGGNSTDFIAAQQLIKEAVTSVTKARTAFNSSPELLKATSAYNKEINKFLDSGVTALETAKKDLDVTQMKALNKDKKLDLIGASTKIGVSFDKMQHSIEQVAAVGVQDFENFALNIMRKVQPYHAVLNGADMERRLKTSMDQLAKSKNKTIGIDTEEDSNTKLTRTIQFSPTGQIPLFIDLSKIPKSKMKVLQDYLQQQGITWVIQNAPYDLFKLPEVNLPLNKTAKIKDTLMMAQEINKNLAFLGEPSLTGQGVGLDKLMNTFKLTPGGANLGVSLGIDKFSKEQRGGNQWGNADLNSIQMQYAMGDVDNIDKMANWLHKIYVDTIKRVSKTKADADREIAAFEAKMSNIARKTAELTPTMGTTEIGKVSIQEHISSAMSLQKVEPTAQAFKTLQKAVISESTGENRLTGVIGELVPAILTNSDYSAKVWTEFHKFYDATKTIAGADAATVAQLRGYITNAKIFSQEINKDSALRGQLDQAFKGFNISKAPQADLQKKADEIISMYAAAMTESVKQAMISPAKHTYQVQPQAVWKEAMSPTVGGIPAAEKLVHADHTLSLLLNEQVALYAKQISDVIPYLEKNTPLMAKTMALQTAITRSRAAVDAADARYNAVLQDKEATPADKSIARKEVAEAALHSGVISTGKVFLEEFKKIKTDDPAIKLAQSKIPADLEKLNEKTIDYVVTALSSMSHTVNAVTEKVKQMSLGDRFKTTDLKQLNVTGIEKEIKNVDKWKKLTTSSSDTAGNQSVLDTYGDVFRALAGSYEAQDKKGLKQKNISVEGLQKPIAVVNNIPVVFRDIVDKIFKDLNDSSYKLLEQLKIVQAQLLNERVDTNALSKVGIKGVSTLKQLESTKNSITQQIGAQAQTSNLRLMNSMGKMAPYVANLDLTTGQEMFVLSQHLEQMAKGIEKTNKRLLEEQQKLDKPGGGGSLKTVNTIENRLKTKIEDFARVRAEITTYMMEKMLGPAAFNKLLESRPGVAELRSSLTQTLNSSFSRAAVGKSLQEYQQDQIKNIYKGFNFNAADTLFTQATKESNLPGIKVMPPNDMENHLAGLRRTVLHISEKRKQALEAMQLIVSHDGIGGKEYDKFAQVVKNADDQLNKIRAASNEIKNAIAESQARAEKANINKGDPWVTQNAAAKNELEKLVRELNIIDPKVNRKAAIKVSDQTKEVIAGMRARNEQIKRMRDMVAEPATLVNRKKLDRDQEELNRYEAAMKDAVNTSTISGQLNRMKVNPAYKDKTNALIEKAGGVTKLAQEILNKTNGFNDEILKILDQERLNLESRRNTYGFIKGGSRVKYERGKLESDIKSAVQKAGVSDANQLSLVEREAFAKRAATIERMSADVIKSLNPETQLKMDRSRINSEIASLMARLKTTVDQVLRDDINGRISELQKQKRALSTSAKPETIINQLQEQRGNIGIQKVTESVAIAAAEARLKEQRALLQTQAAAGQDTAGTQQTIEKLEREIRSRKTLINEYMNQDSAIKKHLSMRDSELSRFDIINRELKEMELNYERVVMARRNQIMEDSAKAGKPISGSDALQLAMREQEGLRAAQQDLIKQKNLLAGALKEDESNAYKVIQQKIKDLNARIAAIISGTTGDRAIDSMAAGKRMSFAYSSTKDEYQRLKDQEKAIKDIQKAASGASQSVNNIGEGGGGNGGFRRGFFGTLTRWAVTFGSITYVASQLGQYVQNLVGPGLAFQKTIEQAQIGMAGILMSVGQLNKEPLTWSQSLGVAESLIEKVQMSAMASGQQTEDVLKVTQAMLGSGLSATMTPDQVVDFAVVGTTAVKQLGLDSGQLITELRDLVQGGIRPQTSTVAMALGITDADISRLSSTGKLFDFLMDKMKGFKGAIDAYMSTLDGKINLTVEGFKRISAAGLEPLYAASGNFLTLVIGKMVNLNALMGPDKKIEFDKDIIKSIQDLSKWAIKVVLQFVELALTAKKLAQWFGAFLDLTGLSKIINALTDNLATFLVMLTTVLLSRKWATNALRPEITTTRSASGTEVIVTRSAWTRTQAEAGKFFDSIIRGFQRAAAVITGATYVGGINHPQAVAGATARVEAAKAAIAAEKASQAAKGPQGHFTGTGANLTWVPVEPKIPENMTEELNRARAELARMRAEASNAAAETVTLSQRFRNLGTSIRNAFSMSLVGGIRLVTSALGGLARGVAVLSWQIGKLFAKNVVGFMFSMAVMLAGEKILGFLSSITGAKQDTPDALGLTTPQLKTRRDYRQFVEHYSGEDDEANKQFEQIVEKKDNLVESYKKMEITKEEFIDQFDNMLRLETQLVLESADKGLKKLREALDALTDKAQDTIDQIQEDQNADMNATPGFVPMLNWNNVKGRKSDDPEVIRLRAEIAQLEKAKEKALRDMSETRSIAAARAGTEAGNMRLNPQEVESLRAVEKQFWEARINNALRVAQSEIERLKNELDKSYNRYKMTIDAYYDKKIALEIQNLEKQQEAISKKLGVQYKELDILRVKNAVDQTGSLVKAQAAKSKPDLKRAANEVEAVVPGENPSTGLGYAPAAQVVQFKFDPGMSIDNMILQPAVANGLAKFISYINANLDSEPTVSSAYRPWSQGSMHSVGGAADMYFSDEIQTLLGAGLELDSELTDVNYQWRAVIEKFADLSGLAVLWEMTMEERTRHTIDPNAPVSGANMHLVKKGTNLESYQADPSSMLLPGQSMVNWTSADSVTTTNFMDRVMNAPQVSNYVKDMLRNLKGTMAEKAAGLKHAAELLKINVNVEALQAQGEEAMNKAMLAVANLMDAKDQAKMELQKMKLSVMSQLEIASETVDLTKFWDGYNKAMSPENIGKNIDTLQKDWYSAFSQFDFTGVPDGAKMQVQKDFADFMEQNKNLILHHGDEITDAQVKEWLYKIFNIQEIKKFASTIGQVIDGIVTNAQRHFDLASKALLSPDMIIGYKNPKGNQQQAQLADEYRKTMTPAIEAAKTLYDAARKTGKGFADPEVQAALNKYISLIQQMESNIAAAAEAQALLNKQVQEARFGKDITMTADQKDLLQGQINKQTNADMRNYYDKDIAEYEQKIRDAETDYSDPAQRKTMVDYYQSQIATDKTKRMSYENNMADESIKFMGVSMNLGKAYEFMYSTLSEGFDAMIKGTKSVGEAFKDMAYNIINELSRILTSHLMSKLTTSIFDLAGIKLASGGGVGNGIGTGSSVSRGTGSAPKTAAEGGPIYGAGTATSDSIPAWLSNGEFVVRAKMVKQYGVDFLEKLNKGRLPLPKFAVGGLVSDSMMSNVFSSIGSALSPRRMAFVGPVARYAEGGVVNNGPTISTSVPVNLEVTSPAMARELRNNIEEIVVQTVKKYI